MLEQTKLPYLEAVVKETLRLAPPVPVDFKTALEDDVLPSGVRVRKGTTVEWCQWNASRLSQYFGDDCDEFRPERWIESSSKLPSTNKAPWIPFQYGPRVCLGMRMALVDTYAALMTLVRTTHFEATSHVPLTNIAITMSVDKVQLIATKRDR